MMASSDDSTIDARRCCACWRLPAFRDIFDRQKDRSPVGQRLLDFTRAEQHCPAPDAFKFMGNFEILESADLRQNILQRLSQLRDVPLAVAEVIDETILASLLFETLKVS